MRNYIKKLGKAKNLIHITEELSTRFEIAAAMRHIAEPISKAVIFDEVKGYDIPVVGNLYGSRKHLSIALGVAEDRLEEAYVSRAKNPIKPKMVTDSPAQEVVINKDIDILKVIPVLVHNEKDAGHYMTSAITIAKDPETGIRGMGLHRIQIKDKDTVGIYLATPPISHFLTKAERLNKPLEIAIISGVSPAVFFGAIFMIGRISNVIIDKFDIAGAFAQEPIELVKCCSVDLEVPTNAEFILEGEIIPHRREKEGPFGESTGYYLTYDNPVAKIRTITRRAKPIYHALMPFSTEEEALIGVMMLPFLTNQIEVALPEIEIKKLNFMALGEICIAQIRKRMEEDPQKVIDYLFSNPFTKIGIVTDEDVNISKATEIAWAVCTRVRPDRDLVIKRDLPGLMIDPSVGGLEITPDLSLQVGKTAKIGIDATKPLDELERFERIDVPAEVKKKVLGLVKIGKKERR
jgi:2,5-furandicarboxylate decarboxylase 1